MHADGLEVEHVFIGERAVFFGAEEGEDSQEFLLVDTGVLHGVEDVVFAVAVDVEGGVEALLVFQEIAFADEAGFPGSGGARGGGLRLRHSCIRFLLQ